MSTPEPNSRDVYREFVGKTLAGLIFDVETATPNLTETHLVFDDGRALALGAGTQYRLVEAAVVEQESEKRQTELDQQQSDLGNVPKRREP